MKYMGSKRAMLSNGLGNLITSAIAGRARFVDMFSGSTAVARYVSTHFPMPVIATDLQHYSAALGRAVLHKTTPISPEAELQRWLERATRRLASDPDLLELATVLNVDFDKNADPAHYLSIVEATRRASALVDSSMVLTRAYGGYYYSLLQAIWLDALRASVPGGISGDVAIAALIEAASESSASPGHTAQPFAPTETGLPHLFSAWSRDIPGRVGSRFAELCKLHAQVPGSAVVADAIDFTAELNEADLAFIDPPYSEVQYSRFYHVLESVALGSVGSVSGVGRYPPLEHRPQSNFSRKRPALDAFDRLMIGVASSGAEAIVTFPEGIASNGLSGQAVEEISSQYFRVAKRAVKSTFSTLGGTGATREARQGTTELMLHLKPRRFA